jgi:glycosyltransferase involved in cell wall biosynthesis
MLAGAVLPQFQWVISMISVCMAVFNGEQYLKEQLQSILVQIENDDEVIVIDDCSRDGSVDLINKFNDPRIVLRRNAVNCGPSAAFARAISLAKGKYILFSDQDDIWKPSKVATICRIFDTTTSLVVVSDARVVDSNMNIVCESLFSLRGSRPGFWRNLYKNGFVGCCMAMRSEAKAFLFPFPINVGLHDEWIGLCSSLGGRINFTGDKLIDYRRHGANATQLAHGSLLSMVRKRLNLFLVVLRRLPRILIWRFRRQGRIAD